MEEKKIASFQETPDTHPAPQTWGFRMLGFQKPQGLYVSHTLNLGQESSLPEIAHMFTSEAALSTCPCSHHNCMPSLPFLTPIPFIKI